MRPPWFQAIGPTPPLLSALSLRRSLKRDPSKKKPAGFRGLTRYAAAISACLILRVTMASAEPVFPFPSGEYVFNLIDAEYLTEYKYPARVTVDGEHIKVVVIDAGGPFHKGQLFAEGTIWWHPSGQWIIASGPEDFDADEVGGCSGGPRTIDVQRRVIWFC